MMINPFIISFVLQIAILIVAFCVAQYVMNAMAMYSIAKNGEINHAWLAWIPVGSSWILGRICDEYDEKNNKRKHWALTLLIIEVLVLLLSIGAYKIGMSEIEDFSYNLLNGFVSEAYLYGLVFSLIVPSILENALGFLKYIAKYKVFESVVPEKSLKYIVITLLVPLGEGICFLRTRHYLNEKSQESKECSEYDKIYNEFLQAETTESEVTENTGICENDEIKTEE